MALTGAFGAKVLRSAIGIILESEVLLNEWQIGRRLGVINAGNIGHSQAEFQGLARQALRITAAGGDVLWAGDVAIPRRELPVDPSIQAGDRAFRYRAVTTITGRSGTVVRTMSTVNSDESLSYSQIQEIIRENLDSTASNRRSVRQSIAALGPTDDVSILLVTAGRAR